MIQSISIASRVSGLVSLHSSHPDDHPSMPAKLLPHSSFKDAVRHRATAKLAAHAWQLALHRATPGADFNRTWAAWMMLPCFMLVFTNEKLAAGKVFYGFLGLYVCENLFLANQLLVLPKPWASELHSWDILRSRRRRRSAASKQLDKWAH